MMKNLSLASFSQKLDSITTYMVVTIGLVLLAGISLVLSWLDILKYSSPGVLLLSLIVLLVVSSSVNLLLSKLYRLPFTQGPTLITALILFFVLGAPSGTVEWLGIAFAAIVAIASKYVITWRGANIFNPAALGVFIVSLLGIGSGVWWVASEVLFVPVLILGMIVLLKLRRFELFLAFIIPAVVLLFLQNIQIQPSVSSALITVLTLYPLIFLGTIMLTEPGTMPATRDKRLVYGALVGLMIGLQFDTRFISTSPHLALLIGNLYALFVTSRTSARLKLVEKKQLSPSTYEFAFEPDRPVRFTPGQYMEFSLPGLASDIRGNRRTFTIASSPQEKLIRIGVKFYQPGSWFKTKLKDMKVGQEVIGNHIAGDFILPKDTSKPLVLVAGGIGITPFISMIKSVVSGDEKHDITLYHSVSDKSEVVYQDVLKEAERHGVRVHMRDRDKAPLTAEELIEHDGARFYLSGPPGFVSSFGSQLKSANIKNVHSDYFSGY